jgi:hypothetical protein
MKLISFISTLSTKDKGDSELYFEEVIVNALLFFIPFVFIGIKYDYVMTCPYFYGFMAYIGILVIYALINYILNKKTKSNEIKDSNIEDTTTQA